MMSSMHTKHLMYTCSLHRAFSCASHFRLCVCRSACTRRVFLEHDWFTNSQVLWHHPLSGLRIFSITLFLCSVTCTSSRHVCVCVCVCIIYIMSEGLVVVCLEGSHLCRCSATRTSRHLCSIVSSKKSRSTPRCMTFYYSDYLLY